MICDLQMLSKWTGLKFCPLVSQQDNDNGRVVGIFDKKS